MHKICTIVFSCIALVVLSSTRPARAEAKPLIGAQIWIEPGQTAAQIDDWFQRLETSGMPVARLFMMWAYMEPERGRWDFSLYDAAFRSAEKHHVRIVATLTPNGPPTYMGGDGNQGVGIIPTMERHAAAAAYIAKVVERYRSSPALDTWLLVNEPGQSPTPNPHAKQAFRAWLPKQYGNPAALNAAWGTSYTRFDRVQPPALEDHSWNHSAELDWRSFWIGYQTTELHWLANQVHQADGAHPLHLNPAGILNNLARLSDDLPAWRSFLDTLGCSIHPAWHFGLLNRDRYALGVSYLNDLVRGSIEPKPYWVTELQGGNNIYSANKPMEPTVADIAQWTWTSVGSGADRVIFWLLNARKQGVEAGEWSLLDFQQQPSQRLNAASQIAKIIRDHNEFFSTAKPLQSNVTLVLSLDTMTFEETYHQDDDPARDKDAHILEALGFYEALTRLGTPPAIKHFNDYDWTGKSQPARVVILPDARALTTANARSLKTFVDNGNTLLISGLTGFYGPHAEAMPLANFPLAEITGGNLKEVHLRDTTPSISIEHFPDALASRLWISSIRTTTARAIARSDEDVVATERTFPAGGRVIWIPSPIGLGAWLTDSNPLALFLKRAIPTSRNSAPFAFEQPRKGCMMRALVNDGEFVTVVTNATAGPLECTLNIPSKLVPDSLWGVSPLANHGQATFALPPRGTSVQLWR